MLRRTVVLLLFLAAASLMKAQSSAQWREWNQPIEPFRIAGSLYYVGAANVTSLLITTSEGHILIDGAFAETAPRILANVRKLGFKAEDIRILLSTHAHGDHAGGLSEIKATTHARLYAGAEDAALLARGGRQDFAFGDTIPFPPVTVDVPVKDGDEVKLGEITVRAIATPGHTKGCTSWAFTIKENGKPLQVIMIGGMSAPSYKLVNNPLYPQIAADYESSFRKLEALPCDIFLEGHGFFFGLEEKRAKKRSFVDPEGYRANIARARASFRQQLELQQIPEHQ